MLKIDILDNQEVMPIGRFDAAQAEYAKEIMALITTTTRVNFSQLDYISSLGLGVLMMTQRRLNDQGHELILTHMPKVIRDVFHIARFDLIFKIEEH